MNDNPNIIVEEENDYYGKNTVSLKQIIIRHLQKISDITCQELTASYMEKKPVKVGDSMMIIEKYHPDLREAYCNSVDFLFDCMMPQTDKPFKESTDKLEKKEEELFILAGVEKWDQDKWIKNKLKLRRELLKEIFHLFERIDFFGGDEGYIDQ